MKNAPTSVPQNGRLCHFGAMMLVLLALVFVPRWAFAADDDEEACRLLLLTGKYSECIGKVETALKNQMFGEHWYLWKADAEFQLGRYTDALATIRAGLTRYPWTIRIRLAGVEIARHAGEAKLADSFLIEINDSVARSSWRYTDSENLVAWGRSALLQGEDAKVVLEQLFDRALKQHPNHRAALLAMGELAIAKGDYKLAATIFEPAAKTSPDDPEYQYGLARALATSQPARALLAMNEVLRLNPSHMRARLDNLERLIDEERFSEADELITQMETQNAHLPEMWALKSAMSELTNQPDDAKTSRERALKPWKESPRVDHILGRILSHRYRFKEGAEAQRRSLDLDRNYVPAMRQLGLDLLRLGDEEEGWKWIAKAHENDGYDVPLFNLSNLRQELAKFKTIEDEHFVIRMDPREASVFGERVQALLNRARKELGPRYGWKQSSKILVEIFPNADDFAVRTFGLPGAGGYLGVCFGNVITAKSPTANTGEPTNWESVLWHEYAHVVTLHRTRNRMPRWLSEGLSVLEERRADPTWGQRMTPVYRQLMLTGGLIPLKEMSSAFLSPKSPMHLMYAYFQASLVVEHLQMLYGPERFEKMLNDLADGIRWEDSFERHFASINQLDAEFVDYAREQARQLGEGLDWENYDLSGIIDEEDPGRFERWLAANPRSYYGLVARVRQLVLLGEFEKAIEPLDRLKRLCPEFTWADNPYEQLAAIYRDLRRPEDEQKILAEFARRTEKGLDAKVRWMEISLAGADWKNTLDASDRVLALQPMLPNAHRARALASEQLGDRGRAISSWNSLLALDPNDQAEVHFQLAQLYWKDRDLRAKSHVVAALEIAPRFRDAQKLLLEIVRSENQKREKPADAPDATPGNKGKSK